MKANTLVPGAAALFAVAGIGWLLVSPTKDTPPPPAASVEPAETDIAHRETPLGETELIAATQFAGVAREGPRTELLTGPWTLSFDLATLDDEGGPVLGVRPPVWVIIEGTSQVLERTVTARNEQGRFGVELEISADELRSAQLFFALSRAAAEARSGTALRLDRLGDRDLLGRLYASDGAWDLDESTLDVGTVELHRPALAGTFSLGEATLTDLSVTLEFYRQLVPPDEADILFFGDDSVQVVTSEGAVFGRADFALHGQEDSIPFGTFEEAQAWMIAARSPDLEYLGSRRTRSKDAPDWIHRVRFGSDIRLPVPERLGIDLWVDLVRLPGAGLILFRVEGEEPAQTLSAAELEERSRRVAVATAGVSARLATRPALISLGNVSLEPGQRYTVEVWSRPDTAGQVQQLYTEDLGSRKGHRKLTLR